MTDRSTNPPQNYLDYPQLDLKDIKLCWHNDYWDGPINGILNYKGNMCHFKLCDNVKFTCLTKDHESYDPNTDNLEQIQDRRFLVFKLTDAQIAEENKWHELFKEYVGTHTDYDEFGHLNGMLLDKSSWSRFYDEYVNRIPMSFKNEQIIGWYEQ